MVPPWRLNEVIERMHTGPVCREKDFDLKILLPRVQELVRNYGISFDPDVVVPSDESLADDLWRAALELYLDVGTYCTTTHRRILFSEEEVKEAMSLFREPIVVGSGRDSREMYHREIEDRRRPFCLLSPDITCDEELFLPMSMAYLQEPIADGVCAPILDEIYGMKIRAGYPVEVEASVAHAMMFREAARRVGRPGIFLQSVGTAVSDAAQIAASNPTWGERLTDGRFVPSISELKMDSSALNKMVHFHQYGCVVAALFGPFYGGLCGGAEGTALVSVAYHIQSLMVNQAHYSLYFPTDMRHGCNTTRELLWVVSVTYQAIARNTPLISLSNGFAAAGPMTEMVLYEAAAHGLVSSVSGGHLWEMAVARNKHKNRATPVEARMACEVGIGASMRGVTRREADELVQELLKRYEDDIEKAPLGKTFQECYDVKRVRPREEYLQLYKKVREELRDIGIPLLH